MLKAIVLACGHNKQKESKRLKQALIRDQRKEGINLLGARNGVLGVVIQLIGKTRGVNVLPLGGGFHVCGLVQVLWCLGC